MMGYFKPLRRKMGFMVLLLVLPLMALWIRSCSRIDIVDFDTEKLIHHTVRSDSGCMIWFKHQGLNFPEYFAVPKWYSVPIENKRSMAPEPIVWRFQLWGIGRGEIVDDFLSYRCDVVSLPYWSIIFPLTVMSAWLLLSRPRAKTKQPITPVSENA